MTWIDWWQKMRDQKTSMCKCKVIDDGKSITLEQCLYCASKPVQLKKPEKKNQ